jgi:hypothetical protein
MKGLDSNLHFAIYWPPRVTGDKFSHFPMFPFSIFKMQIVIYLPPTVGRVRLK